MLSWHITFIRSCVLLSKAECGTMLSSLGGLQTPAYYTHWLHFQTSHSGSAKPATETQHISIIFIAAKYTMTVLFRNSQTQLKGYLYNNPFFPLTLSG